MSINPLCSCSHEPESNIHFFLHCHHCTVFRTTLLNELKLIDQNIWSLSEEAMVYLLLYGDPKYDSNKNFRIIKTQSNSMVLVCTIIFSPFSYFFLFFRFFIYLYFMYLYFDLLYFSIICYMYLTVTIVVSKM